LLDAFFIKCESCIQQEEKWKTVTVILKMKNVNTFRVIKWKKRQILTASFVTAR
jgi:transcription initiation factor IIE alpha subunit